MQENIDDIENLSGWTFFGFNGNSETKEVFVDYVRDENGAFMPIKSNPALQKAEME